MRTKIGAWLLPALAVTTMMLAACGGHVADVGDGDGGSSGDGGASCKAAPVGCTMTSATTCSNGCNECDCQTNGEWSCTMRFCPVDGGPPVCPSNVPTSNSYCAENGQECDYIASECGGAQCSCSNHRWSCAVSDCPAPACPASPPSFGESCHQIGQTCAWTEGCTSISCNCESANNGLAWSCSGISCVDAGVSEGGTSVDAGHH